MCLTWGICKARCTASIYARCLSYLLQFSTISINLSTTFGPSYNVFVSMNIYQCIIRTIPSKNCFVTESQTYTVCVYSTTVHCSWGNWSFGPGGVVILLVVEVAVLIVLKGTCCTSYTGKLSPLS